MVELKNVSSHLTLDTNHLSGNTGGATGSASLLEASPDISFEHEKPGPLGQVSPAVGGIAGKPPGEVVSRHKAQGSKRKAQGGE